MLGVNRYLGDDVDLFDAIPFPLLDDDLTLNTKYLEYKNSDSKM
jgi:predicted nucleotidyltransferase